MVVGVFRPALSRADSTTSAKLLLSFADEPLPEAFCRMRQGAWARLLFSIPRRKQLFGRDERIKNNGDDGYFGSQYTPGNPEGKTGTFSE